MSKPLLVFALEQESQDVFDEYDLLHTGVGKVNAAHALMRHLQENRPSIVINLGTAGSQRHKPGSVINPQIFIQRDMDVTPLGFARYQTPFSSDPVQLEYGEKIDGLAGGTCGSGDNFDVSGADEFDVVEMEAFALAIVCQRENIPFMCLKYISDGADDEAHKDWEEALHDAAETMRQVLNKSGY